MPAPTKAVSPCLIIADRNYCLSQLLDAFRFGFRAVPRLTARWFITPRYLIIGGALIWLAL